uniref:Uncharacterized protein n=1 Tax=Anguilla anguilla TaxID=7936 RepID=A0A0E9T455_ANGAN
MFLSTVFSVFTLFLSNKLHGC